MKIYAIARSKESANQFLERHSFAASIISIEQCPNSLYQLTNEIILKNDHPCILMHDDVYFDNSFLSRVESLINNFNSINLNWGIAGNSGVGFNKYGLNSTQVIKFMADNGSGPNLPGRILAAQSIDDNTILLNIPKLKEYSLRLPNYSGNNLYGLILSFETLRSGLGCFIVPNLCVWHNEKNFNTYNNIASTSDAFSDYIISNFKNNTINTFKGKVIVSNDYYTENNRLDLNVDLIKNCIFNQNPKVAIVVRTQFKRTDLLFRTLYSIKSFIAASSLKIFEGFIVTDNSNPNIDEDSDIYKDFLIYKFPQSNEIDTRMFLLQKAVESISADYFWFIDDDDWLFPNWADYLAYSIKTSPLGSTFYIGAQSFNEKPVPNSSWGGASIASKGNFWDPKLFYLSTSGFNHIPFSGMIFPARRLSKILTCKYLSKIHRLEDYYIELSNFYSPDFFPIIIDKTFVGISLRENGNTVNEVDRTLWNIAYSNIIYYILQSSNILVGLPMFLDRMNVENKEQLLTTIKFSELKTIKFSELKFVFYKKVKNKFFYYLSRIGKMLSNKS